MIDSDDIGCLGPSMIDACGTFAEASFRFARTLDLAAFWSCWSLSILPTEVSLSFAEAGLACLLVLRYALLLMNVIVLGGLVGN